MSYLQDGGNKMLPRLHEKIEDGRYSIEALLTITHDGIMIFIGGGDKPHLGTVVMSQPRLSMKDESLSCTTSVINRLSHMDDIIIIPIAEAICKKANTFVVASGGVHVDELEADGIRRLMSNMEQLIKRVLAKL